MRTFIVWILSCASILGADTGIRVTSTATTNADTGIVRTVDVFTRDGQTNLVRRTQIKDGLFQIRMQIFYHDGSLLGIYTTYESSSSISSAEDAPYGLGFGFDSSNHLTHASVFTNFVVVDAFTCTNGLFYPVDDSLLHKASGLSADVGKLLSPTNVTNTPPAEFKQEVIDLIQKHKKQGD